MRSSELSRDHTLIRYDERAYGLSDWNVNDFSLEAWVNDLEAVVEAAKLERFPLLGISQGVRAACRNRLCYRGWNYQPILNSLTAGAREAYKRHELEVTL